MIHYVLQDMAQMFRYLPYGIGAGAAVAFVLTFFSILRTKKGKRPLRIISVSCLTAYVVIVLCITFLSRELGSRLQMIDMQLFSTWGSTMKSHALAIENVVLFVPYGYLCAWNWTKARGCFGAFVLGGCSSLLIESMQLVTARGYFQIDDIIANTLGMLIGVVIWRVLYGMVKILFDMPAKRIDAIRE